MCVCVQDTGITSMQTPLINIKASQTQQSTVTLEMCEFRVEVSTDCLTARNITDSFSTTTTPCFISTSGSCLLDVSHCTIVGTIGTIGSGTKFRFCECIFKMDERIITCLESPVPLYQDGLQRILYSEGRGVFFGCDFGGAFTFIQRMGKRMGPVGCSSVPQCNVLTFDSCKFTLSPHPGVKIDRPIMLQSDNVVLNIIGDDTVLNLPVESQMYNKEMSCLLCQSVPWNLLRLKGKINIVFSKRAGDVVADATDAVTGYMRHMRFFSDGTDDGAKPMFQCVEPDFQVQYSAAGGTAEVPATVLDSLVHKSRGTFVIRPEFRLSLVNGMDFVAAIQHASFNNSGVIELDGGKDIIVPRHATVTNPISIKGRRGGSNIIMMSPVLLYVKTPTTVSLHGLQIKNVSSKSLHAYFSTIPQPLVPTKPGNLLLPSNLCRPKL